MSSHVHVDDYVKGKVRDIEAAERHLERCSRCRGHLPVGPEVGRARIRLMSETLTDVGLTVATPKRSGALVALGAGALVLLLAVPVLLLPGSQLDEITDSDAVSPLPPDTRASTESFVLTFEVGEELGWLLWENDESWAATRMSRDGVLRYQVGLTNGGMFIDSGDDRLFSEADIESIDLENPIPDSGPFDWAARAFSILGMDGAVPWEQLASTLTPAEQWNQLTGEASMSEAVASSDLASHAAAANGDVAEFDNGGRLVAWRDYRASAVEVRPVSELETQSFGGRLAIEYAAYLAAGADAAVRPIFDDAWVTKVEYENAAELAVRCAEQAGASGDFQLDSVHAPGEISLGGAAECGTLFFDPVDELWRLQVRASGFEAFDRVQSILDGNDARLEMLDAEIGERVDLASGDGWTLDVAPRGEGWCIYVSYGSSSGHGCATPSEWFVPDLLNVDLAFFPGESENLLGVTGQRVARVVATFSDGRTIEAYTQNESNHSIRGFGFGYEFDDAGVPQTLDLYDSAGDLILQFELEDAICSSEHPSEFICGGD
jgi:hypothetical protein